MEKAILVMDMPDSCAKCPFVLHDDEGWLYCGIHNSDTAYAFERAGYCPLMPMERIVERLEDEKANPKLYYQHASDAYEKAIEIVKEELN